MGEWWTTREQVVGGGGGDDRSARAARGVFEVDRDPGEAAGVERAQDECAAEVPAGGDGAEAGLQFQAAVASDQGDSEAHLRLGKVLLSEGHYEVAAIYLEQASHSPRPEVRAAALEALHTRQ